MKSPKSKPSKTILTLIPVIERLLQSLVVRLFHRLCLDASCRWSRNPPSTVNQTAPNAVKDYASERPDAGPNRTASPELARAFQLSCGAYARDVPAFQRHLFFLALPQGRGECCSRCRFPVFMRRTWNGVEWRMSGMFVFHSER